MPLWAGAMRAPQKSIPFKMLTKGERFTREDMPTADGTRVGAAGGGPPLNPVQRMLLALCTCSTSPLR
jgi:hypothetical protein